jgi:hypothetical protein
LEQVGPILTRCLESKGWTWEAELVRKRTQRTDVIGWADDPIDIHARLGGEDLASEHGAISARRVVRDLMPRRADAMPGAVTRSPPAR